MRPRKRLLFLLAPAWLGAYQYYYGDNLTTVDPTKWVQNGSVTATSGGLTAPGANGGSLISTVAVPDGSSKYEVNARLTLGASGGAYVIYLRASNDALSGPAAAGTYYAVEIQNPTFQGSACTATMASYKRVGGVVSLLHSAVISCRSGMKVRAIWVQGAILQVFVDDVWRLSLTDGSIASGKPGIGARGTPSGNSIARVDLGPMDRLAPVGRLDYSVLVQLLDDRFT